MADRVSNTFTGRFTEGTTWYILGGILHDNRRVLPGLMKVVTNRGKISKSAGRDQLEP